MNPIEKYIKEHPYQGFKSIPRFSIEGDFIEYYIEDVDCYAKQIGTYCALMLAMDDHRVVGVKLYGIKETISK